MSLKVLIVDDQRLQREYISGLLRRQGVLHVETAVNGAEALARIRAVEFDLVMTDLRMPGGDGVQLIQRIAELENRPQLALISASPKQLVGTVHLLAKLLSIKVIGQLCKPVQPADIQSLIQNMAPSELARSTAKAVPLVSDRNRMLEAMANGEIQVWYQPKQVVERGTIFGAEALVRWVCPDGTVLPPASFLPSMAMHGLEKDLTLHVLAQSLLAQAAWREGGYSLSVSINLPSQLLDDRVLPDELFEIVIGAGGDPSRICFELTENSTTSRPSDYYAGACRLRMMGFGLAQDDFGQGYSSMHNLATTPFTELKIDREFVQRLVEDEKSRAIVESAIMLGSRLGLTVVAEGVETAMQYGLLRELGCYAVQGFYVSGAVNPTILLQMLRHQSMPRQGVYAGTVGDSYKKGDSDFLGLSLPVVKH
jgi:EAL domain-containing protein (putative c-di-GMP-specific phosphodiesterase class I)/CheY-like chemotaxis protein